MKKQNRRSKQTSVAVDPSPPQGDDDDKMQEHHSYEKRLHDLEKENEALKSEIRELKCKTSNSPPTSSGAVQKLHRLEEQVIVLTKKLNAQYQFSSQRQKTGELGKLHQGEVQQLKAQKVQLMCKIKLGSVQFRLSKASLEKEVLQLKKEKRKNEYEMRNLLALNQRQKLVLQRKTEEAAMATKRLKELLESRKASSDRTSGAKNDNSPGFQGIEVEFKLAARVEEMRAEYERQMEEMAEELRKFEEEAETLREENFRYLLQNKEVECMARDSELTDLKEEFARLNKLVNESLMPRAHQVHAKKPQVDPLQSSIPVHSFTLDAETSESGYSGGNVSVTGTSAGVCCSCSKKSLCKTSKCECRGAGGCCGAGCGCVASKCTNREVVIKANDSPQLDIGTLKTEKAIAVSQPLEMENACEPRARKPLCDTTNTLIHSSPEKRLKTRGKKPAAQLQLDAAGGGPKEAGKIAVPDKPKKPKRSARSGMSGKNP